MPSTLTLLLLGCALGVSATLFGFILGRFYTNSKYNKKLASEDESDQEDSKEGLEPMGKLLEKDHFAVVTLTDHPDDRRIHASLDCPHTKDTPRLASWTSARRVIIHEVVNKWFVKVSVAGDVSPNPIKICPHCCRIEKVLCDKCRTELVGLFEK